jgi:hypothetical protein
MSSTFECLIIVKPLEWRAKNVELQILQQEAFRQGIIGRSHVS